MTGAQNPEQKLYADPPGIVGVDRPVRPRAWLRVSNISGQSSGVFETQDVWLRSERLEPLYTTADVEALVNQFADDERNQEALRWRSRVDGLNLQLRDMEARYWALVKAVADGVAMQPAPALLLATGPNDLSSAVPKASAGTKC